MAETDGVGREFDFRQGEIPPDYQPLF